MTSDTVPVYFHVPWPASVPVYFQVPWPASVPVYFQVPWPVLWISELELMRLMTEMSSKLFQ